MAEGDAHPTLEEMTLTLLDARRNRTSNKNEKWWLSTAAHILKCKGCDDKR